MDNINWVEGDKRVGRKNTPDGDVWPELDVFGQPYSQPASTIVNDVNPNYFVVLPGREIKPDEWAEIRESFSTTAAPVALEPEPVPFESNFSIDPTDATPNDSEPDERFQSFDVTAPIEPPAPSAGSVSETPTESQTRKRSKYE